MSLPKRILNSKWILLLLLLAFLPPAYLNQNSLIDLFLDVLKLSGFLLVSLLYLIDIRKHIQKLFNILLLVLWIELFFSTWVSPESTLHTYLITAINTLGTCFLAEEIAIHSPDVGLKSMYLYFSACVLINTATVFLYPNAMYANNRGLWVCWLLGEDNAGYIYYIVASTIVMIYTQYNSKRITIFSGLVWVSSFIFVFYRDIATGKACQIIWAILVFGYQFGWFRKLLKARYILYAIVGGFVILALLRGLILEPIVSALGRNITLSGRTVLWDRALERIKEKPLLGFGMYSGEEFDHAVMNNGLLNAHNWLLMLMFYGGIIAVVLFSIAVICACRDAKPERNSLFYRCMVIGLIVLAVRFLVEAGQLQIMFMMLAMLAYSKELSQGLESVQTKKKFVIKGIPRIRLLRRNNI